tara:strand:- start:225 stop:515 length:291 start_codon:yes stop_codon:yes gene_type:complete
MSNESEAECINCYTKGLLNKKTYKWLVIPRAKDIAKGLYDEPYWATLTIYLCNDCANTLKEYNIQSTEGWDKWDAIDNLLCQIPDLSDIPIIPAQP